jgi:trimeric autotransporter adhesin
MKAIISFIWLVASLSVCATTLFGLSVSEQSSSRTARHLILPTGDGGHHALNPSQAWSIAFDARGFTVSSEQGWQWGLEMSSAAQHTTTSGNHLFHHHANGITEWFINRANGLQQGWIINTPIDGIPLKVRGVLKPQVSTHGVSFEGALTYSGLKAWDATGRALTTWFEPAEGGFVICFDDDGAVYPVTVDPFAQAAFVKVINRDAFDQFGSAMAVEGDTMVVSAPGESSSSSTVNTGLSNNSAISAGAVYVFVRSGGIWTQQAYLKAKNAESGDEFGNSVALSGDTLVVGAPLEDSGSTGVNGESSNNTAGAAGAAYVFVRSGNSWTQQAYLKASNTEGDDRFGERVAISGNTIVVGARGESSNSGINGDEDNNALPGAGAAYVFVRTGSTWKQQAYLKASNPGNSDFFGTDVGVSGNTIAVGARNEASNATGVNGNQADNTAGAAGAVYVFVRTGSTWSQQAYIKASNTAASDTFGAALSLSGDALLVGANGEDSNATGVNGDQANNSLGGSGAAYLFQRTDTTWVQKAYIKPSNTGINDGFGVSVSLSRDRLLIGSDSEDSAASGINGNEADNTVSESGAAYLFRRTGDLLTQVAYLKASHPGNSDRFGLALALSDDTAVIGADQEDSNGTGIGFSTPDNSVTNSGAAYVFDVGESLFSLSKTGISAAGGPDLLFGAVAQASISNSAGPVAFTTSLTGAGSTLNRNTALYSTSGNFDARPDLALQRGTPLGGFDGLPANAKADAIFLPLLNDLNNLALFQVRVTGTGLTTGSNTILLIDNGIFVTSFLRTGRTVGALSNTVISSFREVVQRDFGSDQLAIAYTLRPGISGANATNDTGVFISTHDGSISDGSAREDAPAYGGGGKFGSFSGRMAVGSSANVAMLAKFIPTGGAPLDSVFVGGSSSERITQLTSGQPTPGGVFSETMGTLQAVGRFFIKGMVRGTIRGSPVSTNEAVWNLDGPQMLLRKGADIGGGVRVSRIIRLWGGYNGQLIAHVVLSGTEINARNNQALILRQTVNNYLILLQTGTVARGFNNQSLKIGTIQAVDVDTAFGQYIALVSLTGASASANQALYAGVNIAGNNDALKDLRLPKLITVKGSRYFTRATQSDTIRSIKLHPPPDASGISGRGLAQSINTNGEFLATFTGERGVREFIKVQQ